MPRKTSPRPKNGERVTRPDLPRAEPIRSWSTLFGPNGTGDSAAPRSGGAGDSVPRGVELGYRVIDDYLRQGAAVASSFANPSRARTPSGDDLPRMTERMLQYASDFTSLWFDAMGVMMGNARGQAASVGAPPAPGGTATGSAAASENAPGGRSRYVLEVRSERAAEVIVALDEPLSEKLTVEPLRARPKGAAIDDVAIKPPLEAGGPLRVRVHVPSKLAPGRYTGAVLDAATGRPRGRLTVLLSE